MWLLDRIAESRIAEAIERGELDDLPGSGKPLAREEDMLVPAELRAAYRVLRNANCLPPELEARREIASLQVLLRGLEDAQEQRRLCARLDLLSARLDAGRAAGLSLLSAEELYREKVTARLGACEKKVAGDLQARRSDETDPVDSRRASTTQRGRRDA